MFDKLIRNDLFAGVTSERVEELFSSVEYRLNRYKKNSIIVHSGDICDKLLIIIDGEVRGEMLNSSGKMVKIEDIKAPEAIATIFLFGSKNRFPVDVVTNCESTVIHLPKSSLMEIMVKEPRVMENYLGKVSDKATFLTGKIRMLSFNTIKGKIADYILSKAGENKRVIKLNQSQQKIADLFGVTRPSLSRVLKEMEQEGIIEMEKKEITLLDRKRLKQLLES